MNKKKWEEMGISKCRSSSKTIHLVSTYEIDEPAIGAHVVAMCGSHFDFNGFVDIGTLCNCEHCRKIEAEYAERDKNDVN